MILSSIEEYRSFDAANSSYLKKLWRQINNIDDEVDNAGITIGTLIESTFDNGLDWLKDNTVILDNYPGETFQTAVDLLAQDYDLQFVTPTMIADYIQNTLGKYNNYKLPTLIEKVKEETNTYVETLRLVKEQNKYILSTPTYNRIEKLSSYLISHPLFSSLRKWNKQVPIVADISFTYENQNYTETVKILPDFIAEFADKVIIVDMKYSYADPRTFMNSVYFKLMYYVQKELYVRAAEAFFGKPVKFYWLEVTDAFMKGNQPAEYACLIEDVSEIVFLNDLYGMLNERMIPTLEHLLMAYKYHKETQDLSIPYELTQSSTFTYGTVLSKNTGVDWL